MGNDDLPIPEYDELEPVGKAQRDLLSAIEMLQDLVDGEPWTFAEWKSAYYKNPHVAEGIVDVANCVFSAWRNLHDATDEEGGEDVLLDGPFDPL